jgi:hypothetical protein
MWKQVIEDGCVVWVNEQVGNVMKLPDGSYVAMVPKVIKLGPFDTLEKAQKSAENKESLKLAIENYNLSLTNFKA